VVDTAAFGDGFSIGAAWGLSQRWQADVDYVSTTDSGTTVQLVSPGFKYLFLKPDQNNNWFISFYNKFLIGSASSGTTNVSTLGYFVGTELGYKISAIKDYLVFPYVGLLYNNYKLGTTRNTNTYPKAGLYFGIPLGGGSVAYLKQVLTGMPTEIKYAALIGYHFPIN